MEGAPYDDGFAGGGGGFDGGAPSPRITQEQQIINILENMSTLQLYEMMAQMKVGTPDNRTLAQPCSYFLLLKTLVEQNRELAREILLSNPQFAFALLQAQVILGMVEPTVVQV